MCSAHPLFGHVIAGSYKKGAAHPAESVVCLRSLRPWFFYSTTFEESPRIRSSSIGLFFLSSQVCSQRFYRKDHLGRHMKIHQSVVEVPLPRSTERRLCVTFALRRTERRLCVTFAPRRLLVRKRIDRPFIVNLAAFCVECAANAFTEKTT